MFSRSRFLVLLLLSLAFASSARPQASYTGGSYTQNFDTLPSSGTFTLSGAGPFALDAAPVNASSLAGWSFAKYAGSGTNALFQVNTGSGNSGAVYSYGAASATDRALGALCSGSTVSRFGFALRNDTGSTITQFTLAYTGEQWRRGSASANTLAFSYALGASDINTGTFTPATTLNFTAPVTTGSGVALDGNAAANRTAVSATVLGLTWAPGQTLVLRWTDVDDSGSDDGLAIDDLTFTTDVGSGPTTPAVVSTIPADGAVNVAPAANLSVTFNTQVNTTSSTFNLTGSSSGAHTVGVLGGPTTFTLVPSPAFAEGENVTLTVSAAQVTDAATGTLHPLADYTATFTTLTTSPIPIHTVQGSGTASPYVGQNVTITGIVTAALQGTGGLSGFYVQAPESEYDSDATTSEGIFVFNTSFPVTVGELVKVTGTVAEFGTAPATQTELTSVSNVVNLATGVTLPAPIAVNLPFASATEGERYEGMRVTFPQTLTVTDNFDLGHFGEVILSLGRLSTPTNVVAPGAPAQAQETANLLRQILVDDASSVTYPDPTPGLIDSAGRGLTLRAGATAAAASGIFDEKFGAYILEATSPLTYTDANPRADAPTVHGSLRISIGNVLNFFNGDGSGTSAGFPTSRGADTLAEYQRQRAKIIAGITALSPDIMGLTEVENDGYGPTSALADLVAGLNAAAPAGTTYAFIDASAVEITTDLIHVALIYRTQTVAPVGAPATLSDPAFNNLARNPLAQTFQQLATGEKLTVSINHWRAKGSAASGAGNTDSGDGQGTNNALRVAEANALVSWLATDPTHSGDPDFLIIGDLNSYAKEDPIATLENAGYINLTEASEGTGGYSYSFNGEFGHLDHALASPHLAAQFVDAATWHVNSDEPVYYDYNLENKDAAQQAINVGTPYRYSDHDPVLSGFDLHPDPVAPAFITQPASQTATVGDSVTFTAAASGYPAPTYQWQHGGTHIPGATSASLTLSNLTTADAGNYTITATNSVGSVTSDPATLTVNQAAASVTLGDLAFTYDAAPHAATVTTDPAGLTVAVTYDGSATPPTDAGSYAVVATITDADYTGSASGTLTIAPAGATVTLGDLTQTYDGSPKPVSVTTTPAGLAVNVTYDGSPTAPSAIGSYAVVATVADPNYTGSTSGTLTITTPPPAPAIALIRHGPTLNAPLDGSLQVTLGENFSLNSGASISADLLVPGTPTVRLNSGGHYGSLVTGSGSAAPAGYTITLNSGASVARIVTHTDAVALPTVAAPPAPTGTRSVSINRASDTPGNFATLKNLTLNSGAGLIAVPAGTYGAFTANHGGFVLGVAGSTTPTVYNFQSLTFNSGSQLQVVGPVIIVVANGFSVGGANLGASAHPEWLQLRVASGGLTLNSNVNVFAFVTAPNGTVTLNNATLTGSVTADRLTLNSGSLLRVLGLPFGY